jgi:hypothetical protein
MMEGSGHWLQQEVKRLGGLTVGSTIVCLDECDPSTAAVLRDLGEAWLERRVWVQGSGNRLRVETERTRRTVARPVVPWKLSVETEWGPPFVRITAE